MTGWQHGRTAAQTFGPDAGDPRPETLASLAQTAEAVEPPLLEDVERIPDIRDDPDFEPTPPGHPFAKAWTLADWLTSVEQFASRYVAFPSEHEPPAVALWVAHAHLVERFETSPPLAITSAEMRSGKTRLLDVLELLVLNPFRVITPSEAVVYTVLAQRPRRTMLLDEADAIFGPRTAERYEGLRAILNAGNRQGTPVLRVKLDGRKREVDAFDVYGPKALAGIGKLPDTISDRSIPIRLKRRARRASPLHGSAGARPRPRRLPSSR